MNIRILSVFIVLVSALLIVSCNPPDKQAQIIPEERMLPSETMENIFYEMHLADAIVSLRMVQVSGHTSMNQYQVDSLIYESIYAKYGCTRESFEESILWYLQNEQDKLRSIYEGVVERFNQGIAESKKADADSVAVVESNTL